MGPVGNPSCCTHALFFIEVILIVAESLPASAADAGIFIHSFLKGLTISTRRRPNKLLITGARVRALRELVERSGTPLREELWVGEAGD
jgi:hypothetical protein